jgi:hypothetical protein
MWSVILASTPSTRVFRTLTPHGEVFRKPGVVRLVDLKIFIPARTSSFNSRVHDSSEIGRNSSSLL